jgi:hypothetical protein
MTSPLSHLDRFANAARERILSLRSLDRGVRKRIQTAETIFIAYSHSDRRIARRFYRAVIRLRKRHPSQTVFYDEFNVAPISAVSRALFERALKGSQLFIVLCGADTHGSAEVNREIALALDCGIDILPITLKTKIQFPPRLDFTVQAISLDRVFPFRLQQWLAILSVALALVGAVASAVYADQLRRDYVIRSTSASGAAQNLVDGDFDKSLDLSLKALPTALFGNVPENLNDAPIRLSLSYNQIINGPQAVAVSRPAYLDDIGVTLRGVQGGAPIYYTVPASPRVGDMMEFDQLAISPDGRSMAVAGDDPTAAYGDRWLFILRPVFPDEYRDAGAADFLGSGFSLFPGRAGNTAPSFTLPGFDAYAGMKPVKTARWTTAAFDIYHFGRAVDRIEVESANICARHDCAISSMAYISNDRLVFGLRSGELIGYDTKSRGIIWHRELSSCRSDTPYTPPERPGQLAQADCAIELMIKAGNRIYAAVGNGTVVSVDADGSVLEPANETISDSPEMTNGTGDIYAHRKSDYCEAQGTSGLDCSAFDAWLENGDIVVLRKDFVLAKWSVEGGVLAAKEGDNGQIPDPAPPIADRLGLKTNDLKILQVRHLSDATFIVEWSYETMKGFSTVKGQSVLGSAYNYGGTILAEGGHAYLASGTEAYEIVPDRLKQVWDLDGSRLPSFFMEMESASPSRWVGPRLNH